MPADALYYDSEFNNYINSGGFNAQFVRSYGRDVTMPAILSNIYTDMASAGGFNTLYLIFHGTRSRMEDSGLGVSYLVEGTGIVIGSGRLTSANVELLRPFRGYVRQIYLFSCSIASREGSLYRPQGEMSGFDFCSAIARTTGAYLYAAANVQNTDLATQRQYNGTVYRFNPDGTYIMQQNLPDAEQQSTAQQRQRGRHQR